MSTHPPRDIIVMGASTAGVEAVKHVLPALTVDLPVAVFVVIHRLEYGATHLAELLRASSLLRLDDALHGERIEHGRVSLAPADNHLLVREGYPEVVRGARENGHRPALNPLFRSAAAAYGSRVIGVLLTGALDCGTFGLMAIKARGGVGVAQDPSTATGADMPKSDIDASDVTTSSTSMRLRRCSSSSMKHHAQIVRQLVLGGALGTPADLPAEQQS